jgi:nucleotide-binding universal stress UspA family protein
MFVVGTRRHGAMRRLEEFVSGSIAKELAMGQERPVLLVPMSV